jgi:hypothetical protein
MRVCQIFCCMWEHRWSVSQHQQSWHFPRLYRLQSGLSVPCRTVPYILPPSSVRLVLDSFEREPYIHTPRTVRYGLFVSEMTVSAVHCRARALIALFRFGSRSRMLGTVRYGSRMYGTLSPVWLPLSRRISSLSPRKHGRYIHVLIFPDMIPILNPYGMLYSGLLLLMSVWAAEI